MASTTSLRGAALDAPAGSLSAASAMAPARSALVLLVDDDPESLKLLSGALAGEPVSLAVAIDGEMALRQVKRELPDLILLDAVMPRMDGFEPFFTTKAQGLGVLEAEDPQLGPWLQKARALAEGFRVHELRAMLALPEEEAAP